MQTNIEWERLHDASLLEIVMNWGSGETHVQLRLSEEASRGATIVMSDATLLRCPRQHPWGPSVSINEVRVVTLERGRKRIEIEVQSGDVLVLEGSEIEFRVPG